MPKLRRGKKIINEEKEDDKLTGGLSSLAPKDDKPVRKARGAVDAAVGRANVNDVISGLRDKAKRCGIQTATNVGEKYGISSGKGDKGK